MKPLQPQVIKIIDEIFQTIEKLEADPSALDDNKNDQSVDQPD